MSLILSIEQLKDGDQSLAGELTAEELGLELRDELVTGMAPLSFDLSASQLDDAILVRGRLQLPVDCECARCLRALPIQWCWMTGHFTCRCKGRMQLSLKAISWT